MHRQRPQSKSVGVVVLGAATAGQRIAAYRMASRRTVFSYDAPDRRETAEEEGASVSSSAIGARINRWRTHEPFSPVSGTALRPVADAANTVNILREVLRGPR